MTLPVIGLPNYFERKAAEPWEKIKYHFLLRTKEEIVESESAAKDLVDYRHIIDYKLYGEAIERIFPNYNIVKDVRGHLRIDRIGRQYYKLYYYEFEAYPKGMELTYARCRIRISPTGSCTLTSPIANSIMTYVEGDTTILFAGAHSKVREGGLDYEGRITNAIIDFFYRGNERELKQTSRLHRNSNAYTYTDLIGEEEQRGEYRKFNTIRLLMRKIIFFRLRFGSRFKENLIGKNIG